MFSPSKDQALTLGLGFTSSTNIINKTYYKKPTHMIQVLFDEEPSLALSLSSSETNQMVEKKVLDDNQDQPCSVISVGSSLSNIVSVKREKECASFDDLELERGSSRISEEEEDGSGPTNNNNNNTPRKKLRLTKEQSVFLEESFKQQSTLNPKQKQVLADQLNLRPRQVEVWFQNRRARTKLKQTEVDYEYLKKCCETLKDENKRLQKELQDLKAINLGHPFYMNLQGATLTMCPSCERIGGVPISSSNSTPPKVLFGLGLNKSHFYSSQQISPLLVD